MNKDMLKVILGGIGVAASIVFSSFCGGEMGKGLVGLMFKDKTN